jgi:hypothetical protein
MILLYNLFFIYCLFKQNKKKWKKACLNEFPLPSIKLISFKSFLIIIFYNIFIQIKSKFFSEKDNKNQNAFAVYVHVIISSSLIPPLSYSASLAAA